MKHPSRVRGPAQWTGPGNDLAARFGCDAAHAEWFYGFRLAVRTDLGSRIVRAWAIVPTAVSERDAVIDLLEAGPAPRDLLADKGFSGRAFEAELAACGTAVLVPPDKRQPAMLAILLKSSPSGATGSRRPSARSPTGWNSPATAPTPSGACSPGPQRPSPPTPCSSPA